MSSAHAHPTTRTYWTVFAVLFVVTGLEVWMSYLDMPGWLFWSGLMILMAIKFVTVVAFFMHLRFDKPLYRNFFLFGIIGAIAVFVVVLATFRVLV